MNGPFDHRFKQLPVELKTLVLYYLRPYYIYSSIDWHNIDK